MWLVGLVITVIVLTIPVLAIRRHEMRLAGPTIIRQERHPILFWVLVALFALAGCAAFAATLGAMFG